MTLLTNISAYYKFDSSNSNDSVGSSNGTDTSITYSTGNGIISNGAGFNGSTSVIDLGNPSALQITGPFSISFWTKQSVAPSAVYGLLAKTNDASQRSWGIWNNNSNGINFQVSSDGTGSHTANWLGNIITDTVFHYMVFTFDPNGGTPLIKVYKDGTDVTGSGTIDNSTWAGSSTVFNSTSDVIIGNKTGAGWPYNGAIDEVGIWSRVLTSSEVTQLYNSGAGLQYPFGVVSNQSAFFRLMA